MTKPLIIESLNPTGTCRVCSTFSFLKKDSVDKYAGLCAACYREEVFRSLGSAQRKKQAGSLLERRAKDRLEELEESKYKGEDQA